MNTETFTPDMIKALAVTGRIVTVRNKYQGRVLTVEGRDWTTVATPSVGHYDTDPVTMDLGGTPLDYLNEPECRIDTGNERGNVWVPLSQVSRGVCLGK